MAERSLCAERIRCSACVARRPAAGTCAGRESSVKREESKKTDVEKQRTPDRLMSGPTGKIRQLLELLGNLQQPEVITLCSCQAARSSARGGIGVPPRGVPAVPSRRLHRGCRESFLAAARLVSALQRVPGAAWFVFD
jgi:hypothetical protein